MTPVTAGTPTRALCPAFASQTDRHPFLGPVSGQTLSAASVPSGWRAQACSSLVGAAMQRPLSVSCVNQYA